MSEVAIIEPQASQDRQITSKPTDERRTPRWLFDALDLEFRFAWDAAARAENCLCFREEYIDGVLHRERFYFGPDHPNPAFRDALAVEWHKVVPVGASVWLNGPYSRGAILKFCAKAQAESEHGLTIVSLIPGDVSTEYYHRYVLTGERRTVTTRLKFEGAPLDKNGQLPPAKFGSVLRIFRPTHRYWSFQ